MIGGLAALSMTGCARGSGGAKVDVWAMGNEAAALPKLIRSVGGQLPGRFDVQALPWSSAHEKLLTGFAGGSLPTVSQIGNSWVAELAAIGAIEPLPSERESLLADQFPAVLDTNRIGGRIWAVPWYVDTRLQFYRRDLFEGAGCDAPPARWSEWKAALAKIKAQGGGTMFGVLMPVNEYEHLTGMALSAGASLLDADGARGAFRQPEFLEALGFYKSLFDEKLAPLAAAAQISNVWTEFARGFFAVYPSGPWTIGDMRDRLPPEMAGKWGTAPNPGPDGIGASAPGGSSLVVFRGARDAAAGWDLIQRLVSAPGQRALQVETGDLPAMRSVWTEAGLASGEHTRAFLTQLENARPLPKVPEWERIVSEMQVVAERMLRGEFTVSQAAAEMDIRADRLLEKRRWMLDQGRAL